jgi:bacterioferritin
MAVRNQKGKIWDDKLQRMLKDGERNLEEGPVTEAYKADKEQVIQLLDRALASEWTAFLQYYHHHFMATDIHSAEIREYFKEAAAQELHHIEEIGERIQMLGGVPTHKPQEIAELWPASVEYGHDLRNMLEVDLVAERGTINFYSEIVRFCGFDDIVTRVLFEEILREEHEHANELADLLYAVDASTNEVIPSLHEQIEDSSKGSQQRKIA